MSREDLSQVETERLTQAAREYLQRELGERAPVGLELAGVFAEQPLEGEGKTALLRFELAHSNAVAADACGGAAMTHFVAVGETVPNYFPAYSLDAEQGYSLHVGTRFMLELGIQKIDNALEPPNARSKLELVVRNFVAGAPQAEATLAALFRCEEQFFAVYRLALDGKDYYAMGADCPPGFYELTDHPPQLALRLHLGQVIRAEARAARELESPPDKDDR